MVTGFNEPKVRYNILMNYLEVTYKDNENKPRQMAFNEMSDGHRSVLSMIADIAYRMSLLNPQFGDNAILSTPGVVLIDEIDQHLHPAWQQHILADLKMIFPKVQFIVTTHSPSVIQSVRNENVILLNDSEIIYPNLEIYGKDANVILEDIMGSGARPIEIQERIDGIYTLIDNGNIEQAKEMMRKLEIDIDADDHELVGLRTIITLEEADD
jgi:predicted ATP-binding protein involved in virulence